MSAHIRGLIYPGVSKSSFKTSPSVSHGTSPAHKSRPAGGKFHVWIFAHHPPTVYAVFYYCQHFPEKRSQVFNTSINAFSLIFVFTFSPPPPTPLIAFFFNPVPCLSILLQLFHSSTFSFALHSFSLVPKVILSSINP